MKKPQEPKVGDKVKIKRTTEDCAGLVGEIVKINQIGYGVSFGSNGPKGILWFRRDEFEIQS